MDYKDGALSKKKEEKKKPEHSGGEHRSSGGAEHKPHIHIHSHEAGHTMHVMHHDGSHEMHHFAPGDTAGMQEVLAAHLGGGAGGGEPAEHMEQGASPEQEQQEAQAA